MTPLPPDLAVPPYGAATLADVLPGAAAALGVRIQRGDLPADPLGLTQAAGPRAAIRQVGRLVKHLPQQAALRIAIGTVAGRPEGVHPAAVGLKQSDSNPVERGPAHQTKCGQHHVNRASATPCSNRPADDDQLVPNTDIL